jgi:hypothetical protein
MATPKAEQGNWDEDFKESTEEKKEDTNKADYMKFDEPGDYRVRLVGSHVKFLKYWQPFNAITHPDYIKEGVDPVRKAGFYYDQRYAIHVFDRQDENKLKILDRGNQIFKKFAKYKAISQGVDPAGKEAPEFIITVEMPKDKKTGKYIKRQTKYQVMPDSKVTPLTEEEIQTYKENRWPLKDLYKATPLEIIQKLWNDLPDDKKVPPKKKNYDGVPSTEEKSTASENPESQQKDDSIEETVDTSSNVDELFDEVEENAASAELF